MFRSSEPPDTSLLFRSSKPLDFLVTVVRPSLLFRSSKPLDFLLPAIQILKTMGLWGSEAFLDTTFSDDPANSGPQNHWTSSLTDG
jgi:hypothetical protein